MRAFVLLAVAASSALMTNPVQAAPEPLKLAPTSKWHVDYADERCRLAREFGEGTSKTTLFLDKYGPGESFRMVVAGGPVKTDVAQADLAVRFGPTEQAQPLFFLNGNLGESSALVFGGEIRIAGPNPSEAAAIKAKRHGDPWIELAPIAPERYSAVRYLEFGKPLRKAVQLETGSLKSAFAALDKCVDDLVASWGVDIEKHKTLSRNATPTDNPGKWVVSSDYPIKMLQAGQPAFVDFRLSVGADGKPSGCKIQATTRPKEFDDAVCQSLMRRASFLPALDASGQPIASWWRSRVRFQLPG
ncbi:energy transducer TonB [Sphingorhabdus buctiana]|uniref:Energy transducer TonB n=1 Tax=Sphingorhabdus buctiana TaxID=1508805 RepID=A0ABW4MCU6_9SPHN